MQIVLLTLWTFCLLSWTIKSNIFVIYTRRKIYNVHSDLMNVFVAVCDNQRTLMNMTRKSALLPLLLASLAFSAVVAQGRLVLMCSRLAVDWAKEWLSSHDISAHKRTLNVIWMLNFKDVSADDVSTSLQLQERDCAPPLKKRVLWMLTNQPHIDPRRPRPTLASSSRLLGRLSIKLITVNEFL